MLTHLMYSDQYHLEGTSAALEKLEWTSPASTDLDAALQRAQMWIDDYGFGKVIITSATTGELIAECTADEDESFEDYEDDVDECGYNPYMGCYDFDC